MRRQTNQRVQNSGAVIIGWQETIWGDSMALYNVAVGGESHNKRKQVFQCNVCAFLARTNDCLETKLQ